MLSLEVDIKFELIGVRKVKEIYKSRTSTLRNIYPLLKVVYLPVKQELIIIRHAEDGCYTSNTISYTT
jgi:hypothetical protein